MFSGTRWSDAFHSCELDPLASNHYKINVDDAVFKAQKVASVGVLV